MTYDGAMVLPSRYVVVDQNEMEYIDGGMTSFAVLGVIATAVTTGVGMYNLAEKAGERVYYMGLTNVEYQSMKWYLRAGVMGLFGVIWGPVVLLGFENGFYSLAA